MCCGCSNIIKAVTISLLLIIIIILAIIVVNNNVNKPSILVAIAKKGDNTELRNNCNKI